MFVSLDAMKTSMRDGDIILSAPVRWLTSQHPPTKSVESTSTGRHKHIVNLENSPRRKLACRIVHLRGDINNSSSAAGVESTVFRHRSSPISSSRRRRRHVADTTSALSISNSQQFPLTPNRWHSTDVRKLPAVPVEFNRVFTSRNGNAVIVSTSAAETAACFGTVPHSRVDTTSVLSSVESKTCDLELVKRRSAAAKAIRQMTRSDAYLSRQRHHQQQQWEDKRTGNEASPDAVVVTSSLQHSSLPATATMVVGTTMGTNGCRRRTNDDEHADRSGGTRPLEADAVPSCGATVTLPAVENGLRWPTAKLTRRRSNKSCGGRVESLPWLRYEIGYDGGWVCDTLDRQADGLQPEKETKAARAATSGDRLQHHCDNQQQQQLLRCRSQQQGRQRISSVIGK